ncbi:electron transfer flavoprotein beta subunit [Photobacterium aphoticum]|uniref:Electron transfer flavoprotein beta subunit n=1 Tax=Photobacterium aphoticum TaxID=754436 RepID=A0A090QJF8_9GAMM|nr:electron transfer flavoprotein beta subunit [Photobacterium aphoticum]
MCDIHKEKRVKVLVAIKRVIDPYVKVRVNKDGTGRKS